MPPKPFVFVLMPFAREFDDVYALGIAGACAEAGAYCERVDEQNFDGSVLDRIYNQVGKADLVVADMTGRSPNVFYEVGYAHGLGKRVFLLTSRAEDIPFDLKHYPHIVYGGSITTLKKELAKKVRWALEHRDAPFSQVCTNLEVYLEGVKIENNPQIPVRAAGNQWVRLVLDHHNSTERVIEGLTFQAGFVTTGRVTSSNAGDCGKIIKLPSGGYLHLFNEVLSVAPDCWEQGSIDLRVPDGSFRKDEVVEVVFKAFTKAGSREYPFTVKMV